MQTILLVEDDKSLLKVMKAYFLKRGPGFAVLTATDGEEALQILAEQDVDVMVTDLYMPGIDGFELLARVAGGTKPLPTVVISAVAQADEVKSFDGRLPGFAFLSKPFPLSVLSDAVEHALGNQTSGMLNGITLASLLQILAMERKSCTLRVSSQGRLGVIHIQGGELVQAKLEDLTGVDAACTLLSLKSPQIEIDPAIQAQEDPLKVDVDALVMEATFRAESGLLKVLPKAAAPPGPSQAQDLLKEAMSIPGVLGVALLDTRTATIIHVAGSQYFFQESEVAAMVSKLTDMGNRPGPEEITFLREHRFHLLLPLAADPMCFLHAVTDRSRNTRSQLWRHLSMLAASWTID